MNYRMNRTSTSSSQAAARKKQRESVIETDNCCTSFVYNLPHATILVTLPGVIILIIGAILTSVTDFSQGWLYGNALTCLIFLALGGTWTLGCILFTIFNYCKKRSKFRAIKRAESQVMSRSTSDIVMTSDVSSSLELVAIHQYPGTENPSLANSRQSLTPAERDAQVYTVS